MLLLRDFRAETLPGEKRRKNTAKIFWGVLELLPWGLGLERVPFFCWLLLDLHTARMLTTTRTCVLTKHVLSVFPVSVKKELHIQENGSSTLHLNPH